jgi:trypsin-like peptidase
MPGPVAEVAAVRDSCCALMRIVRKKRRKGKNTPPEIEFRLAFVGTAWCVSADRFLVTAHHVFNGGSVRDPNDRFHVFTTPGNSSRAYHFPVTGFPFEDPSTDLAILEIGPPTQAGQHIPDVPVTFSRPPDGTPVVTYGYPSPVITGANVDQDGNFLGGGQFFLKGHANEGIIAAQYDFGGTWQYEFNVGWHHGESGGPVFRYDAIAAVAIMQSYRNITSPHGVVAGPHCGRALDPMQQALAGCNATIV